MKKIGLITFHASHNNGSMLQALALQTILEKKYNCKVEIIDFSNEGQRNLYAVLPKAKNWKQVIKKIIWATNYLQLLKQYNSYNSFSKKYFNLTKDKYYNTQELIDIIDEYDAFISGSDQVWNVKCIDSDPAYFLSFVSSKPKYAYAVSFGANNPFDGESKEEYITYVNKFNKISVREKNAKKWIKEATEKDVPICLDPTMLFNEKEWEDIVVVNDSPIIKGKYIFYYCFGISKEVQKFLRLISKKMKMPIYFIEAKEWTLKMCWKNGIKLVKHYGPDVYLNLVKNSEVFITSSFHGTAFATIYKKNFWYIRSKDSESSLDDRAITFLSQLGLMSRYLTINELLTIDLYLPIDYEDVNMHLKILQERSFEYLDSVIEEI